MPSRVSYQCGDAQRGLDSALAPKFGALLETLIRRNLTHADGVQSKRRSCSDWRLPIFADSCSCPQDLTLRESPAISPRGKRRPVQTSLPSHLISSGNRRGASWVCRECLVLTVVCGAALCGRSILRPPMDCVSAELVAPHDYLLGQVRSTTTRSTHAAMVILGAGAVTEDRMVTMQGDKWSQKGASSSHVMTKACRETNV